MNLASRRLGGSFVIAACAALIVTAPAQAGTVTASKVSDESCIVEKRTDDAVGFEKLSVPGVSAVSARLTGAEGNWDLAVVDETGRVVAASAYADGEEIAEGFTTEKGDLHVQACRRSGSDETAEIATDVTELTGPAPRLQMVRVAAPDQKAIDALNANGFDLTEHAGNGYVDVVLSGQVEAAKLNDLGFDFDVLSYDLAKESLQDRAAESQAAARGAGGGLPSGRTGTYRELADYSTELQQLAEDNPKLVRYFTLKNETYSGRKVEAIEIAPRVKRKDGRPTFAIMGAHHAREWPGSEHTIEFAYELIKGYKNGNKKVRKLLKRSRVVVVPIVSPDGFNVSRSAGAALGASGGRDAPGGDETPNLLIPMEYQRKNCRTLQAAGGEGGNCMQVPNTGLSQFGVDPNRNYGAFWGGPGAATGDEAPFFDTAQDYRGPGPFSEPETQNIQKLVSTRQVTTLITNHTFSGLVLHPPGLQAQGKPVDDKALTRLSDRMAKQNGYTSQRGYELYDTSGTTEDWSYSATGGYGFTFEIGPSAFHPAYASMIDEYNGTTDIAKGGNRAAYMLALKNTVSRKQHSILKGSAPKGAILTLKKKFKTPSSPVLDGNGEEGDVLFTKEKLKSVLKVGKKGKFTWHVNPSTRPIADPRLGKTKKIAAGKPSKGITFSGPDGTPTPCADADTTDPACWSDHGFKVPNNKANGRAKIEITWPTPASDWDLKVFRDKNGDGSSEGEDAQVGTSAGMTNSEMTTASVIPGDKYVIRVINYAALESYDGTIAFKKAVKPTVKRKKEKYTLTCQAKKGGPVIGRSKVYVKRGKVKAVRPC